MSQGQKVIKYLAISLAFLIIFSIVYGAYSLVVTIVSSFTDDTIIDRDIIDDEDNINSKYLKIELVSSELLIQEGERFLVNTDNKYVNVVQDGDRVVVKEKSHLSIDPDKNLVKVTVPKDFSFDKVDISGGAGKIKINRILSKILNLDLGAGLLEIDYLDIGKVTKIEGGAGKIVIRDGRMNNLNLDIGAGSVEVTGWILGDSEIDSGVGKLVVNLTGVVDDYQISLDKGIGAIKYNNSEVSKNRVIGTGRNKLEIDGGIGTIDVFISE